MGSGLQRVLTFLFVLAAVGFLFPRFDILGVRVSITDLTAFILALLALFYIKKNRGSGDPVKKAELIYGLIIMLLGFGYGIIFGDIGSVLIGLRMLSYAVAGLLVFYIDKRNIQNALIVSTIIILSWFLPDAIRGFIDLIGGGLTLGDFIWSYEGGRLTAPHELYGVTSTSSVPLGYLFSLMALFSLLMLYKKFSTYRMVMLMMALLLCLMTASRAAILASVSIVGVFVLLWVKQRQINLIIVGVVTLLAITVLSYDAFIEKSFIDDGLDGSSTTRLEFYSLAVTNSFQGPIEFLFGFGVSDTLLVERTGIAFYESLFFNSLAQGGVILAGSVSLLLIRYLQIILRARSFEDRAIKLAVLLVVFIGNIVGGSNYFSIYAFFYFALVFCFLIEKEFRSKRI